MIVVFENGDVIEQPQNIQTIINRCVPVSAIILTPNCCDLVDNPANILKYLGCTEKVTVSQIADVLKLYDDKQ